MRLIAFTVVVHTERGWLAVVKYLGEQTEAEVMYELEKKASTMQTFGPFTRFDYVIEVSNFDCINPKNLYPLVREIDKIVGELE